MTGPATRLRLAFVVQRYGPQIDGGAEYECRRVAEALASHHDVEVLTTCARDYLTWRNVDRPGLQTVNGVRVRRFPVDRPRRVRAFGRYADWLYATPHTFFDEAEWVRRQGPLCPALIEWIRAHADDHDAFLFYTYLYLPDDARAPAGRPQGGPGADRPRRAADLPRPLPEPLPDPARADLPGGGGEGVRGVALPHGATSPRR